MRGTSSSLSSLLLLLAAALSLLLLAALPCAHAGVRGSPPPLTLSLSVDVSSISGAQVATLTCTDTSGAVPAYTGLRILFTSAATPSVLAQATMLNGVATAPITQALLNKRLGVAIAQGTFDDLACFAEEAAHGSVPTAFSDALAGPTLTVGTAQCLYGDATTSKQVAGDCQKIVCDGAEGTVSIADDTDTPASVTDPTKIATCQTGSFYCKNGVSHPVYTASSTLAPASAQSDGDCLKVECDGAGGLKTVYDNKDPPKSSGVYSVCQTGKYYCSAGKAIMANYAAGYPVALDAATAGACHAQVCDGKGGVVTELNPVVVPSLPASGCVSGYSCLLGKLRTSGIAPSSQIAAAAAQTAGDCQQLYCDGKGGTTSVEDDTDTLAVSDCVLSSTCSAGVPSNAFATSGTDCSSSSGTCDGAGNCVPIFVCFTDQEVVQVANTARIAALPASASKAPLSRAAFASARVDSAVACDNGAGAATCVVSLVSLAIASVRQGDFVVTVGADGTLGLEAIVLLPHPMNLVDSYQLTTITFARADGSTGQIKLTPDHALNVRHASAGKPANSPFVYSATGPVDFNNQQGELSMATLVSAGNITVGDQLFVASLPSASGTAALCPDGQAPSAACLAALQPAAPVTVNVLSVSTAAATITVQDVFTATQSTLLVDGVVASPQVHAGISLFNRYRNQKSYAAHFAADPLWALHAYGAELVSLGLNKDPNTNADIATPLIPTLKAAQAAWLAAQPTN